MKLLCVIPSYWPAFQYGGPIASNHNLNMALAKKGIDVTVYTTNVGLNGKIDINNKKVNINGVKVVYFNYTKLFEPIGTTGWQFSWCMTEALKKNLKKYDITYIPAIWNYPAVIAGYYCRQYSKPYIIAPKGSLYPYTIKKKEWKKWPYYKLFAEKNIKSATAIHYTSEDEAEKCHLRLALKNKAIIVSNGIDLSEFTVLPDRERIMEHYPILKDKKIILFLGRINWKKGLDILVKAYSRLAKERSDIHLLIVGSNEGGYEKKLRRWLKNEGVLERVTLTGMLSGREKLEAFIGSDVFVLPSYSENFGMAVVEAMACNLPTIISNQVGICKEVKSARAGLVIHTDQDELYRALIELLDNKKKSLEIGRNGRKLVEEQFSIEKVADKMIKIFEEIIK